MNRKLRFWAAAIAVLFWTATIQAANVDVNVISFNDFHGALIDNGPNDKNPGAAKFVQAIKDTQAKLPNNVVVSAGDNYTGSSLSNLLYGKPVNDMLKLIGIKASAVGNHEFDWGLGYFTVWQQDMGAPYLSANIVYKDTQNPIDFAKPYLIVNVAGINVAFIGLTTQETAYKTKPDNVANFTFEDPVAIAKRYVPIVKKEGADIVILLTHIGTEQQKDGKVVFEKGAQGLPKVKGVDAVITAHSHQFVDGEVDGTPVVQAWYNGRALAILTFTVDDQSKKIVKKTHFVDNLANRKASITPNPQMQQILNNYLKQVSSKLNDVVCTNESDLSHSKDELSPLGQWTTDLMREKAQADIAVTNGGGLRTSIPKGKVTVGKFYEVMPFDNVLSNFEMTGKQIKEVFEHGINNKEIGWIQYSGVIVTYRPEAKEGSKIVSITLYDGTEIKDNQVYKVVTNDFMAVGGDNYTTFLKAKHLSDTIPIRDAMIEKARQDKVIRYTPKKILFEAK